MSQGPYGNPPPPQQPSSGGGMSIVMIVIIVLVILGLICAGACGLVGFLGYAGIQAAGGLGLQQQGMMSISTNPEVIDKLGEPLTESPPSKTSLVLQEGSKSSVEFEVVGSKGKGKAVVEATMTKNGFNIDSIRVDTPQGPITVDPKGFDPTELQIPGTETTEVPAPTTPPDTIEPTTPSTETPPETPEPIEPDQK